MAFADIWNQIQERYKKPEFSLEPGKGFSDKYAFTDESLQSDPFAKYLQGEKSVATEAASRSSLNQSRAAGYGSTSFGTELAGVAGESAARPYIAQEAQLGQILRDRGYNADVQGLGLSKDLYGVAVEQNQFDVRGAYGAGAADEQQRLKEEEEERKRQDGFLASILGTASNLFLPGIGQAAGDFIGGLFGTSKESRIKEEKRVFQRQQGIMGGGL